MYKFRIVVDVMEDENGIHQDTTICSVQGGVYNRTIAIGALEVAKIDINNDMQKE